MAVVKVANWPEAKAIGHGLVRWAFRGHASSEWGLSSSLERAANAVDSPLQFLGNREYWMRTQFMRRAHHYLSDLPEDGRHIEWLALMQHHGCPTRLLDFTYSFYVAAFFALESAAGPSAVWAVNLERLESFANRKLGVTQQGRDTMFDVYQRYTSAAEEAVSAQEGPTYLLPVEPFRVNERLSIQQGLFLMGCDVGRPFVDNLAGSLDLEPGMVKQTLDVPAGEVNLISARDFALIKIVLPHEVQYDALRDLRSMNITAATLFPGLDGFSRSLSYHLHGELTNKRMRAVGMDPEARPDRGGLASDN